MKATGESKVCPYTGTKEFLLREGDEGANGKDD